MDRKASTAVGRVMGRRALPLVLMFLGTLGAGRSWDPARDDPGREFDRHARQAVPRDAFPVFDEPEMVSAARANRVLRPGEWVIGVDIQGDARAYPVAVMGVAELGNDVVGGEPITVCW